MKNKITRIKTWVKIDRKLWKGLNCNIYLSLVEDVVWCDFIAIFVFDFQCKARFIVILT